MASQQKSQKAREKTCAGHHWDIFLNPLSIVFLDVGSSDAFAKARFFREQAVTERWEEAALWIGMIVFTHPW